MTKNSDAYWTTYGVGNADPLTVAELEPLAASEGDLRPILLLVGLAILAGFALGLLVGRWR